MTKSNIEWRLSTSPVPYPDALDEMERRVVAIEAGTAPELIWLLEHPPTYTSGTSAEAAELLNAGDIPVFETGRGGRYTYHGPGQRVIYVLMDLRQRDRDLRAHVVRLEEWMIRTLAAFGITGERREGRIGIWVAGPPLIPPASGREKNDEEKIGAIGVRVRRWVTYHGLALNVEPDLAPFKGIVPCGIAEFGVTSMRKLGVTASMAEVDAEFERQFTAVF